MVVRKLIHKPVKQVTLLEDVQRAHEALISNLLERMTRMEALHETLAKTLETPGTPKG